MTIATWSDLDRNPGYAAMATMIAAELGDDAAERLRAPFSLGTADDVGSS
ncbi:MAG: hypothetical protein R2695_13110 [Acidimicrobiales bacterium]